jgi:hypothetical protein
VLGVTGNGHDATSIQNPKGANDRFRRIMIRSFDFPVASRQKAQIEHNRIGVLDMVFDVPKIFLKQMKFLKTRGFLAGPFDCEGLDVEGIDLGEMLQKKQCVMPVPASRIDSDSSFRRCENQFLRPLYNPHAITLSVIHGALSYHYST